MLLMVGDGTKLLQQSQVRFFVEAHAGLETIKSVNGATGSSHGYCALVVGAAYIGIRKNLIAQCIY